MKIKQVEDIAIDEIYFPSLKVGSNVEVFSVYNKKDSYKLKVVDTPESLIIEDKDSGHCLYPVTKCSSTFYGIIETDIAYVNTELLKKIKNSNDVDSSIQINPCDITKHRYGFVYKSIGDKTLKCLNVNNPKTTKYFPMVWDAEFIPEGIDSAITRIEDGVCGRGFIEKNGCMVIDLDNEQVVKADIEKFGFEKMIRINMLDIKSWDDYEFEYFDLDITNTLDVLKLFPNFFKSESDVYESLNRLIDKEESEIMKLVRERNKTKQTMMCHKDDPDALDRLYKEAMRLKYEINSRYTKYDDEFMKAIGVNKNE